MKEREKDEVKMEGLRGGLNRLGVQRSIAKPYGHLKHLQTEVKTSIRYS